MAMCRMKEMNNCQPIECIMLLCSIVGGLLYCISVNLMLLFAPIAIRPFGRIVKAGCQTQPQPQTQLAT